MLFTLLIAGSAFLSAASVRAVTYESGDKVVVLGVRVGPFSNRHVGRHPYSLPICTPDLDSDADWAKNSRIFEELPLSTKKIIKEAGGFPSPTVYSISYLETVDKRTVCTRAWSTAEKEQVSAAIRQRYFFEFYCDGQFVRAFVGQIQHGWFKDKTFVYTHLTFTFMYKGTKIVAVHIKPEDVHCLDCEVYNKVSFSYSVVWLETDLTYDELAHSLPSVNFFDEHFNEKDHVKLWDVSLQWPFTSLIAFLSILAVAISLSSSIWQKIKPNLLSIQGGVKDEDYDLIVKIDWFHHVKSHDSHAYGNGWEVAQLSTPKKEKMEYMTSFVAVLGLYNKGKTFVLNRVGGTRLPEGVNKHTEGISFKRARDDFQRFTLVDIAGFDAPVQVDKDHESQLLGHRKSVDLFIQDVVLWLSLAYIVVIGDITLKDQQYLNELSQRLHKFKAKFATKGASGDVNPVEMSRFSELIVVHNFAMERNLERCLQAFESQVTENYTHGSWVDGREGRYYVTKEIAGEKAGMRHVFIGRSSDPGTERTEMDSHNDSMFQLIRQWIVNGIGYDQKANCLDEIVKCCNIVLPEYMNRTPPKLVPLKDKNQQTFIRFPAQEEEEKKHIEEESQGPQVDSTEELMFLYDATYGGLNTPPKQPSYDILRTDDSIFIYLDSAAMKVQAKYNPRNKTCRVTGVIPKPKPYSTGRNTLVYRKRYVGQFDFEVNLSVVPGSPPFLSPILEEEEVEVGALDQSGSGSGCLDGELDPADMKKTVIKLKIQESSWAK